MDEVIINTGVPPNEADFLLECIDFITGYTIEMSEECSKKFPEFRPALFMGNLLVNSVSNILLRGCPENDMKTFNDFCEVFIERFIHCKNTIILHASKAEGGIQ